MKGIVSIILIQTRINVFHKLYQLAASVTRMKDGSRILRTLSCGQQWLLCMSAMLVILAVSPSGTWAFGESTSELVYTPVTPCRVLDTRFATDPEFMGPITGGGTVIDIAVNDNGSHIPEQGGKATGCPDMPTSTEPPAVVMTITAVPLGSGNFRAFAYNDPAPLISVLNWGLGRVVANTTTVSTCSGCAKDISIQVDGAAAHIIIDVVGYFGPPTATPVDIQVLRTTDSVANNTDVLMFSDPCPSGWNVVAGGFEADFKHYASRPGWETDPNPIEAIGINVANSWMCKGRNETGATADAACWVVCARTTGN